VYLVDTAGISVKQYSHAVFYNLTSCFFGQSIFIVFYSRTQKRLSDIGAITSCQSRGRVRGSQKVNVSEEPDKMSISHNDPKRNMLRAHFFPSLNPPTRSEFQRGSIFDLRAYKTCARYSCISAGPKLCPSCAVNSSIISSSRMFWMYWKSDMSPPAPMTVWLPTACRRWTSLNRAREPYEADYCTSGHILS
jgi:hypothetical protein